MMARSRPCARSPTRRPRRRTETGAVVRIPNRERGPKGWRSRGQARPEGGTVVAFVKRQIQRSGNAGQRKGGYAHANASTYDL